MSRDVKRDKPIAISPAAAQDLDDAYFWYERQKRGLGSRFLAAVNVALQLIQRTPAGYQTVYQNYRKALLRVFPYVIFYREEEDQIFISAIFHTSRSSKSWQDRLE
jgi:plasmid stabilization system protein ParE